MGYVDAEPVAAQLLRRRRRHRRAAAAEGVEDHVALVGGCGYDALQQGLGFLGLGSRGVLLTSLVTKLMSDQLMWSHMGFPTGTPGISS